MMPLFALALMGTAFTPEKKGKPLSVVDDDDDDSNSISNSRDVSELQLLLQIKRPVATRFQACLQR